MSTVTKIVLVAAGLLMLCLPTLAVASIWVGPELSERLVRTGLILGASGLCLPFALIVLYFVKLTFEL